MNDTVTKIVVVGGGTAGWLAACAIAARADRATSSPISVTLVESPDTPTIGVGEGTWPTLRRTLQQIGIGEAEFLIACDGAFKQGSRFDGWRTGADDDRYYHPFTPPLGTDPRAVMSMAFSGETIDGFADAVGVQAHICAANLAPRQRAMPDFAGALNYAYHLDAGKLAALLMRHGTQRLGVRHVSDHVVSIAMTDGGDVAAVATRTHGAIKGDLFIDCTGHAALLIGERLESGKMDRRGELFNDTALAVQVPVAPDSVIASQTNATAHAAGWIWDIGLPTRRGIGCVYASAFVSDDAAVATLRAYVGRMMPSVDPASLSPRRLSFASHHRDRSWVRNCIAIGQSAGFLEPLEASAIVMIELGIEALLAAFPTTRGAMPVLSRRYNEQVRYRWDRIVDFLKLHYVLSQRGEPYWRAHRDPATLSPRLAELLDLWRYQPPSAADLPAIDEVFPAASYQYILYGMGFTPPMRSPVQSDDRVAVAAMRRELDQRRRALTSSLPSNRAYLDALRTATGSTALEPSH